MAARTILTAPTSSPQQDSVTPTADAGPRPPTSVGARWRLRRNLVIFVAHQQGVSQRMLADVFDLPHSRIAAIVKELRTRYGPNPQRLLE